MRCKATTMSWVRSSVVIKLAMERAGYGWGAQAADGWRKGPWTAQEDKLLIDHVNTYGEGRWNSVAELTGLKRSGKSCRLRWVNYLRPHLKKGKMTPEEENLIMELHELWGNRWSTIARSLPGRTDNEIKNYWRTHFKKNKPSKNVERARAQFLKHQNEQKMKQEELMHEYELQQRQQQHLQQQAMSMAMRQFSAEEVTAPAQDTQDMATCLYPFGSFLHDGSNAISGTSDCSMTAAAMEDVDLWGSLWNLDGLTALLFDKKTC